MKNQLKTLALLGGLSALLIGIGAVIGPGYVPVFAVLAVAVNLGAYFFSDRIVLSMNKAREISEHDAPWLHATVAELATRANIPKPRIYMIDERQPNAFATGRNPKHGVVAVTRGIVDILSPRELRGVLAHELAHIKNRDILIQTIAAAMSSVVTYVAHALSFAALFGGRDNENHSPIGSLLIAIVAPIGATLIQLGISRSREYLADETGAAISGDPEALASALAKLARSAQRIPSAAEPATASLYIVNPLAYGEKLRNWFSTHPPMDERIHRLLAMRSTRSTALATQIPNTGL